MATERLKLIFEIVTQDNKAQKSVKAVGEQAKKSTKEVSKLNNTFEKLVNSSKKVEQSLANFTTKAGVAFAAFTASAGLLVREFSKFEDIGVQFQVLTGNIETADKALRELKAFSAATPFQFEDIAQAGKQLLGFGFQAEEIQDRLREIGDVAAASGKPIQDISLIFGQVAAAGKLTGERLLQFQERAIPIGPAIAKTLGIAETQVKDFVSKGKVNFDVFIKSFQSLSKEGGFAFGGLNRLSQTLSGRTSTLRDNFSQLAANIGERLAPTLKTLVTSLTEFVQFLNQNESLVDFTSAVVAAGLAITGTATAVGGIGLAIAKIIPVIASAKLAVAALGITLKGALIGTGVGAVIVGLGLLIADLAENWDKRVAQIKFIWESLENAIEGTIIQDAINAGIDAIKAYRDAFLFVVDSVITAWDFWESRISGVIDKVSGVFLNFSKLTAQEEQLIQDNIEDLGKAFEKVSEAIEEDSKGVIDGLIEIEEQFDELNTKKVNPNVIPVNFVERVKESNQQFSFLNQNLDDFLNESINTTTKNFVELRGKVEETSKSVKSLVTAEDLERLKKLRERIENIGLTDFGKLQKERDKLLDGIKEFVAKQELGEREAANLRLTVIQDFNEKRARLEKKALDERIAEAKEALSEPFTAFFELLPVETSAKVQDKIQGILDSIPEEALTLGFAITGFTSKLTSGAKEFTKSIVSGVGNFLGPKGKLIAGLVNAIIDVFGDAPAKFIERIERTIAGLPILLANIITNVIGLLSGKFVKGAIVGLVENMPQLAAAFTNAVATQFASPIFWIDTAIAFVAAIVRNIPEIIQGFIDGFKDGIGDIINIFKSDFAKGVGDAFEEGFKKGFTKFKELLAKFDPISLFAKLFKLDNKTAGDVESFIGLNFPFVTFAKGGPVRGVQKFAGNNPMNDTVPALLSAGEYVLDKETLSGGMPAVMKRLQSDIGMQAGGQVSGGTRLFGDVGSFIGNVVGTVTGTVEQSIGNLISASGQVFDDIKSGNISGVTETLLQTAQDQVNIVGEGFFEALARLGIPLNLLKIIATLRRMGASIDLKEFIKDPLNIAKNIVKGFATTILKPFFRNLITPAKGSAGVQIPDFNETAQISLGNLKGLRMGGEIPAGFNENFPARLSSNENVLDRSTNVALRDYLDRQGQDGGVNEQLLSEILRELKKPQQAQATVQLNTREFANILIELNRNNVRIA